jgi:hypothetical protein
MSLPQLIDEPVKSGRLKSPQHLPYARMTCELESREPTGSQRSHSQAFKPAHFGQGKLDEGQL